jgi:hypothetical protein
MQHLFTCLSVPISHMPCRHRPVFRNNSPRLARLPTRLTRISVTGAESWRNSEHVYIACRPIIDSIYSGSDADMDADTDAGRHRDRCGESGRAS